ncbi:hypothetical protein KUTeg_019953 [Tegillarca granosa]|uniref:Uncharacterized protein n=1 Tax=Tegillarca granosa TaxID=220873 RepID=A0ABQ9EHZ5_TEGGR|nr:hypothetical protein KUTeg_019953 [Tegillarca granosa]
MNWAVVFQVCIQNRYKLNKKYRKLVNSIQSDGVEPLSRGHLKQSKLAADAENKDNEAEQTRQHGKRVRYGEIVQVGGSVIRLFHKELEAYLVAEGLFDDCVTEDGDILRWEQQVRLRHMLTRQYLCIDSKMDVSLVVDPSDPRTVFRLHSVLKGGIGLNVAQMIVELIRDKRKIVDRITKRQIETFIQLLRDNPDSVYLMDRGQNINKRPNIVYVSTDNAQNWIPLHLFVDGRNDFAVHVITREFGYLTWEDAYLCLTSDLLPDAIRAKYCELIIGLFVDVGNNYSVLDHPNICFVYEYVGSKDSDREQNSVVVKDLVTIFPVLRDWLAEFLLQNCQMTASEVGHNLLIEQVLRLLQYLVKFGYYNDMEDVKQLLTPLLGLLDGSHDVPFPKDKGKGND